MDRRRLLLICRAPLLCASLRVGCGELFSGCRIPVVLLLFVLARMMSAISEFYSPSLESLATSARRRGGSTSPVAAALGAARIHGG